MANDGSTKKSYTMSFKLADVEAGYAKLTSYIETRFAKLISYKIVTQLNVSSFKRRNRLSHVLELEFSDHLSCADFGSAYYDDMTAFIAANPRLQAVNKANSVQNNNNNSAPSSYPNALEEEGNGGYWRLNGRLDTATWNKVKSQFRYLTREMIEDGCADYGCRPGYYLLPDADYDFVSRTLNFTFPTDNSNPSKNSTVATATAPKPETTVTEALSLGRKEQNTFLRRHGYTWQKTGYSSYDAYEETGADVWELWHNNSRIVEGGATQAFDEIERGVEVVLAERKAVEEEKARQDAAYTARQQAEKEAEEETIRQERAVFHKAIEEMEAICQEVEWPGFQPPLADRLLVARATRYGQYSDRLYRGNVNSVECFELQVGAGYDEDGRYSLWCAEPEKAGLEAKAKVESK